METWQDIKDFFFPAMQDTETSQTFFTTTQAVNWANGALWEMAQHAEYLDVIQEQNTVDGTSAYSVGPAGEFPYAIWRVEIDDEAIRPTTADAFRRSDRTWESNSGKPRFYYTDLFTNASTYRLGLYWEPNGVYELRTYSYGVPAQVAEDADTDKLQVPQWAIYGVLWYMLSEAYSAETRRQNPETAGFYRRLYDDMLDRLRARSNNRLSEKTWVVGSSPSHFIDNFWHDLPDTIPEP
ncbi:MAG TPA: hypothetical protein VMW24_03550 [Sedimentisphaerales bacterium]|nr:hypothetical protein [Sedimentisphaerales bacterium]